MKNETFFQDFGFFVVSRFGDSEASLIFCSNEKLNFFSDFGIFRDPDFANNTGSFFFKFPETFQHYSANETFSLIFK